jgi:hypothetical protein
MQQALDNIVAGQKAKVSTTSDIKTDSDAKELLKELR